MAPGRMRKVYASYTEQKHQRHRALWVVIWVVGFLAVYVTLNSLVFSMGALRSDAMRPNLRAGDRFVFSSHAIYAVFPWPAPERLPFRRGSVVRIDLDDSPGFTGEVVDALARFFTAQRVGVGGRGDRVFLKRVIGLPGDEISMTNFVIRVKPRGQNYRFTEFELWDRPYEVTIPQVPALWDETLPFSGDMEPLTLADDECFVLSDDRGNTNDSRAWGPVPLRHVTGKALFRYWPLTRVGLP